MLFGILTQQAGVGPEPPVEAVEIIALGSSVAPNLQTYEVNGQAVTRYVGADVDPASSPWTCRFSPDGMYLAVGATASPFLFLYERNGTAFTKAANPATLPEGQVNGVAFSPDGSFLVASLSVSPYIAIYEINNGALSKLSNPVSVPTGTARSVTFSPDGSLVAVAHTNSPYVTIYSVSGTTLTKLANPATLPPGNAWGAAFSPDGSTLVVGSGVAPYLTAYSVSGQTFTAGTGPDVAPTGYVLSVRFSSDGSYLLAGHVNTPFITKYLVNGAALTQDGSPNPADVGSVYDIAFNSDESLMFAGSVTAPHLQVYENVGGVFTKIGTADTPPTGTVLSLAYGSFGVDPHFSNVVSLLHFDGDYIDVKGLSWTPYGNASINTAQPIEGSGSLEPTNTGGIYTADNPALELGSQDWTIEFFAKQLDDTLNSTILEKRGSLGDRSISMNYYPTTKLFYFNIYEDGTNIKQAQSRVFDWFNGEICHVAVVNESGVVSVYVNGVLGDGVTLSVTQVFDSTEPLRIGVNPIFEQSCGLLIDEFRMTVGVARYVADFTPPSAPFPDQ